jgi:hypothetical protein
MVAFISCNIQDVIDLALPRIHPLNFQYNVYPTRECAPFNAIEEYMQETVKRPNDSYIGSVVLFLNNKRIRSAIMEFRNNE